MSIAQSLLPEYDHEMGLTRKTLERLPDDKFTWKPHEKSMALGQLASHLANITHWGIPTLELAELNLEGLESPKPQNRAEVLGHFDVGVKKLRSLLEKTSDQALMENWTLRMGSHVIFTMPRIAVVRGMILNHMVHHRAQLGVYYRLNDIPVPSIYGPSADEQA